MTRQILKFFLFSNEMFLKSALLPIIAGCWQIISVNSVKTNLRFLRRFAITALYLVLKLDMTDTTSF